MLIFAGVAGFGGGADRHPRALGTGGDALGRRGVPCVLRDCAASTSPGPRPRRSDTGGAATQSLRCGAGDGAPVHLGQSACLSRHGGSDRGPSPRPTARSAGPSARAHWPRPASSSCFWAMARRGLAPVFRAALGVARAGRDRGRHHAGTGGETGDLGPEHLPSGASSGQVRTIVRIIRANVTGCAAPGNADHRWGGLDDRDRLVLRRGHGQREDGGRRRARRAGRLPALRPGCGVPSADDPGAACGPFHAAHPESFRACAGWFMRWA